MATIGTLSGGNQELRLEHGQDLVLIDDNGQEVVRIDASTGVITLRSAGGPQVMRLAGRQGNLALGGEGVDGDLLLYPRDANVGMSAQAASIRLNAEAAQVAIGLSSVNGALEVIGANHRVHLDASNGRVQATGSVELRDLDGDARIRILADGRVLVGGDGHAGSIRVRNADGETTLLLNGDTGNLAVGGANEHGSIFVKSGTGSDSDNVFVLNGERGDVILGRDGRGSDVSVRDDDGQETLLLRGKTGNIAVGRSGMPGNVFIKDGNGQNSVHLSGEQGHGNFKGNLNVEGDINVQGDVRLTNADCAEEFSLSCGSNALPGMVMVLTDDGGVAPCKQAYDSRVVGIISGAGSLKPAIILDAGAHDSMRAPLALSGKVYCRVDADLAPVAIGDLLTTAERIGHARKVCDPSCAFGAILGKAMEPLKSGQGLIRVLTCLG